METIPILSNMKNLKTIQIYNNTQLSDIHSVEDIPNLEMFQLVFSENSKAKDYNRLIEQSLEIVLKSKTIKYTNVIHYADDETKEIIKKKGIKECSFYGNSV